LQAHSVADLVKAFGFDFLTAENQHFLMAFQHLLGAGSHLPHRILHIFTDVAKTL